MERKNEVGVGVEVRIENVVGAEVVVAIENEVGVGDEGDPRVVIGDEEVVPPVAVVPAPPDDPVPSITVERGIGPGAMTRSMPTWPEFTAIVVDDNLDSDFVLYFNSN